MAIRLEKSGGLVFIKGAPDEPKTEKRRRKDLGLWLVLIALVMGALFADSHSLSWPVVSHAFKSVLTAIW